MNTSTSQAVRSSAPEVLASWKEYRESGDPRVRDRLIFMLMPTVRYVVHRKTRAIPAHCEIDDFMACGLEALIVAIDRFDPDKGATLEQYVWTRVQGAVLDELRRADWAPRSLRRDQRAINTARERLANAQGRQPSPAELAAEVGMTPPQLRSRLDELTVADVASLNQTVRADEDIAVERIETIASEDAACDPAASAELSEAKARFREAFARLSRQEREVAVLIYVENWTLRAIGERFGVSESRISQIHTKLRQRLFEQLSGERQLFEELR